MKDKVMDALQRFSKAMFIPVLILPIAGILIAVGNLFTNVRLQAVLPFLNNPVTIGFGTLLRQEPGSLEQLDVEQTLARLTAREEQGVTFVNIERTDQKTRRIRGACIGAALFVAMMAFVMATMGWAVYTDPQDAPPLPLLVVMFGIPAGCIVGTLKVLLERIEEIGKGEEDAYRNY